jgi:hypothetical protein
VRSLILITALLTGCATVPRVERNWVTMFNEARNWKDREIAFQEMERNDYIRFVEQGLKVVGVAQDAGSNPPTGHEREAVIFWTAQAAMEEWQTDSKNLEARNRAVVGMRRLMELERLGWKVGTHVKWLVARIQELDGVRMPDKYPRGLATWHFGFGGYGSYLVHEPNPNLQHDIALEKSGGVFGRALASSCAIFILCRPYSDERWSLRSVSEHVALTIYDDTGRAIRIDGLKPMPGWKEPE